MTTAWEKFQELMKDKLRKVYSEKVIEYILNPRNTGSIPDANAHSSVVGACGDNMQMWLNIKDNKIEKASFWTDGCGATGACGGITTDLATGKTLGEALAISPEVIIGSLGGLPDGHVHCAGLASLALKKAIIGYINIDNNL